MTKAARDEGGVMLLFFLEERRWIDLLALERRSASFVSSTTDLRRMFSCCMANQ